MLSWGASLVAQMVKNLPAMQETWVPSLGQEDPLEKEWQTTPAFLPGKFQGQMSLVGYNPWCHKELDMTEWLSLTPLSWRAWLPYSPNLSKTDFRYLFWNSGWFWLRSEDLCPKSILQLKKYICLFFSFNESTYPKTWNFCSKQSQYKFFILKINLANIIAHLLNFSLWIHSHYEGMFSRTPTTSWRDFLRINWDNI